MDIESRTRTFSRRDFIALSAGALAASTVTGACGSADAPAAIARREIPIGVQLHCVRHQLPEDMPGTLRALKESGYDGVEWADYFGRSATELRQLLDDAGLESYGTHIYLSTLLGDEFPRTVEFNEILGTRQLVIRWFSDDMRDTREALLRTCDTLNDVAERLAPHGMSVGYHNHGYSFDRFEEGGELAWNIFADNTREDVFLQLDTGNAASHVDPVELLRRNPGRHASMHIKPYSTTNRDTYIGTPDDELDWPTIVELSETIGGIVNYIIEYERNVPDIIASLRENLHNFRRIREEYLARVG